MTRAHTAISDLRAWITSWVQKVVEPGRAAKRAIYHSSVVYNLVEYACVSHGYPLLRRFEFVNIGVTVGVWNLVAASQALTLWCLHELNKRPNSYKRREQYGRWKVELNFDGQPKYYVAPREEGYWGEMLVYHIKKLGGG